MTCSSPNSRVSEILPLRPSFQRLCRMLCCIPRVFKIPTGGGGPALSSNLFHAPASTAAPPPDHSVNKLHDAAAAHNYPPTTEKRQIRSLFTLFSCSSLQHLQSRDFAPLRPATPMESKSIPGEGVTPLRLTALSSNTPLTPPHKRDLPPREHVCISNPRVLAFVRFTHPAGGGNV